MGRALSFELTFWTDLLAKVPYVTPDLSIGVGKELNPLPALRTVRAVLPHTALQSLVSSSGVSRQRKGSAEGELPMSSEGPLAMGSLDAVASADTRRPVEIEPSAHHHSGFRGAYAACVALSGTAQTLIGSILTSHLQLPASLPSERFC